MPSKTPAQSESFREERCGNIATFLVPSLKLKDRARSGVPLEEKIHRFLLGRFGGYTASAGNIFGYWKDEAGEISYGEHKEYKVALSEEARATVLKRFLADLAVDLGEKCIYLESGKETFFIYAAQNDRA